MVSIRKALRQHRALRDKKGKRQLTSPPSLPDPSSCDRIPFLRIADDSFQDIH